MTDESEAGPMRPFTEYFDRVWSQALMAVSTAEDEAGRVAKRVADAAGWSQDELVRSVRELTDKLRQQRRALETTVEERVRGSLQGLKVPRRDDVAALETRLGRLAARVEALLSR